MASTKTISKGIRISNESAEYFEGKPLNRMVEGLMELLLSGELGYDGELKIKKGGVHTDINTESAAYKDLHSMMACFGYSMDALITEIDRCMEDGTLTVEGGKVMCTLPAWAERFKETCHDKGLDVEKVAESAIKAVEKGLL